MLSKRNEYIEQQSERYNSLSNAIKQSKNPDIRQLLPLFEDYQRCFSRLTKAYQTIGLDHTQGWKSSFRVQAQLVEIQLKNLDGNLAVRISKTEEQVERISLIIMGVNSATLLFLLIKSFH